MIDIFSKVGWTVAIRCKNAITLKKTLENILKSFKRRPNLVESDDGYEFVNKTFTNLLNTKNIERYSRNTSLGAVFAERFNRTIIDLLRKLLVEKGESNWADVLPTLRKQYHSRNYSSTKLKPIQASWENEGFVYRNL